jgi:hypothetical protein
LVCLCSVEMSVSRSSEEDDPSVETFDSLEFSEQENEEDAAQRMAANDDLHDGLWLMDGYQGMLVDFHSSDFMENELIEFDQDATMDPMLHVADVFLLFRHPFRLHELIEELTRKGVMICILVVVPSDRRYLSLPDPHSKNQRRGHEKDNFRSETGRK